MQWKPPEFACTSGSTTSNVAIALTRLGGRTAVLGKVGDLWYRRFPFSRVMAAAAAAASPATVALILSRFAPPFPPHPPPGLPENRERERMGKREGTWHPGMWGPRGSHADSAATSDKTGAKTNEGPKVNAQNSGGNRFGPAAMICTIPKPNKWAHEALVITHGGKKISTQQPASVATDFCQD
uniref:Uncharacterized protein n=1 Tax=Oryza nivara TaxID=4536 RepID=A0A0E0HYL4_ORYNI